MSDLFWPGDHRAGEVMSQTAFLSALVTAENAWLATLVECSVAPTSAAGDLMGLVSAYDLDAVAEGSERDGNPVTGLVALLRSRTSGETSRWLHRGLTSQDVVDTALMLCLRDALSAVRGSVVVQVQTLAGLTETHRDTPILTRTLTQPALPGTAGRKFSVWLTAVLDAAETPPPLPVAAGGAAGTLAATTELVGSAQTAMDLVERWATALGLAPTAPWHTSRSPVTRIGDALVGLCDSWGHIANDIAAGVRVSELSEGAGGGSSTMPHKNNPVLTVLVRRASLTAPGLGATLHAASAASVDERSDGGWHAEWATLAVLARRTVVAASQVADLLAGLQVHTDRCLTNIADAQGIHAEQQTMADLSGRPAADHYLGATDLLVDAALQRARHYLKEMS